MNDERLKNVNSLACEISEKSLGNADDVAKRVEDLNGRYVPNYFLNFFAQHGFVYICYTCNCSCNGAL